MASVVSARLLSVLLLFIMKNAASINATGSPIAKTQFGSVKGIYADEAAIFYGLPFGMPPVGEMRWKPPQPFHSSWAPSTYDASFPRPGCYQDDCTAAPDPNIKTACPRDGKFSEDCLHLNIFTPLPFNPTENLPVVIWFPGEQYVYGSANSLLLDGRFLANKTHAIVVTTNYRLGALGFLVAGEGEGAATGNYGTLDQIAAMRWVQSNIGSFGGDKDQVTIMGQSSGADSVALHLMGEDTVDLFQRAGKFQKKPFIIGSATDDAVQLVYEVWVKNMTKGQYQQVLETILLGKVSEVLKEYPPAFTGDERPTLAHLATDMFYTCSTRTAIRSAITHGETDVWLYHFDHVVEGKDLWFIDDHVCYQEVCHGSDLPFLLQTLPLFGPKLTDLEQSMADDMAVYFGNFFHTGDPNGQTHQASFPQPDHRHGSPRPSNIYWPKYSEEGGYMNMKFNTSGNQLEKGYKSQKCDFWDAISN
ncbi:CES1 [Branchiostoma lanceolatum]|uniref:Carboxylic ester hydrolase n=1 Tax=Branchiostoma lanceolatum TaxID=7740 RepID=A0A8K0EXJ6_BRALA|nr:CES1 [Branchiostoma lanceolatum]